MSQSSLLREISDAVRDRRYRVLRPSRGVFQSDVYALDIDGLKIVVKDFSARPIWSRVVACRLLIRREVAVLKQFGASGFVPKFFGQVSPDMFAMEFLSGEHPNRHNRGQWPQAFDEAVRFLELFHREGYAHNDFRRSNVLVQSDGAVRFFDFAAALRKPRRCRWLLFPWSWLLNVMQRADLTSLLKMKPDLTGEPLTVEERRKLKKPKPVRFLQYIWSNGINKPILRRFK